VTPLPASRRVITSESIRLQRPSGRKSEKGNVRGNVTENGSVTLIANVRGRGRKRGIVNAYESWSVNERRSGRGRGRENASVSVF
jgi:hypothetical protein